MSLICWLSPQMPVIARNGPISNQNPNLQSWSVTQVVGTQVLEPPSVASQDVHSQRAGSEEELGLTAGCPAWHRSVPRGVFTNDQPFALRSQQQSSPLTCSLFVQQHLKSKNNIFPTELSPSLQYRFQKGRLLLEMLARTKGSGSGARARHVCLDRGET